MNEHLPVILIELVLVFGGVLLFTVWQLRSVRRDQARTQAETAARAAAEAAAAAARIAATTERSNAATHPAPPQSAVPPPPA